MARTAPGRTPDETLPPDGGAGAAPPARVVLVGFMGAGKTSVGARLAARLGVPFVDLDREIERAAGRTVSEIFEHDGEAGFRRLESAALGRTLEAARVVVAAGGGTLTTAANRELIARRSVSVWLEVPFDTLAERLERADGGERPLYRDRRQAERLYRGRLEQYRSADHRLAAGPGEAPERLAERLHRRLVEERS